MENSESTTAINLTSSLIGINGFTTHNLTDLVIIVLLVLLIFLVVVTHISHKYQINKLYNLFSDFTRFYIHISKPPCKSLTNYDLANNLPSSKKSSQSISSFSSTTNSNSNTNSNSSSTKCKIQTIDENGKLVKNFKSRLLQIAKPPSTPANLTNYNNYSKYIATTSNIKNKINSKNQKNTPRRHSTFDLISNTRSDLMQDKFKEKSQFKIKQSESYSFDLSNRGYSNVLVNEVKEKRDFMIKKNEIPNRRSRLMGISDELAYAHKTSECSNFATTSTPNKI